MSRSRRMHRLSSASNSSSSSTSPERGVDDDNDSFTMQANDSRSSLGDDLSPDPADDASRREHEELCKRAPVYRLPAELLISIFARLSSPSDLQSCMLVSKEWARNSVGLLWHRPAMNKWDCIHSVVQSIRKSNKFFAYQDLVKRLNMSTLANQVSDGTLEGMRDCKRIERLTLTNCSKLTDDGIQPLVDGNKSLLALDVTGLEHLTDRTMTTVANNCLRLQGLNVTGCKRLTDASMVAIAKNCRHLKRLKFNNCIQLTDTSIQTIAGHSTHLLEIDLYGLQNLESPAVTALLTSCKHLREMRLAHCSRITDQAFLDIPSDPELPFTFESLRILDLTDCVELGDKGVERIIQSCPRLRNLILAKCRQLTDRAVFAITKLGKNLHYIHLGHCARITDVSVEALAKACNRIRYIDLACCVNLTDSSVTKLAALPKLKRIGLVKCAGITDRSIYALATSSGSEGRSGRRGNPVSVLERVHLSYCTLLTLDGIHVLLNNCPKLTHLSLTGVQAFLRDELLAFCREAPPEFNDHQRDVFCVFSGPGVGRLRDFLNAQKSVQANAERANANAEGSANENMVEVVGEGDSELGDMDGDDGIVINVNVQGNMNFGSGPTPIVPTPAPPSHSPGSLSGLSFAQILQGQNWHSSANNPYGHSNWTGHAPGSGTATATGTGSSASPVGGPPPSHQQHMHLSQSAPASSGPMWGMHGAGLGLQTPHSAHPAGGAQHVTNMMGAAMLDEVDEVDETFGDGDGDGEGEGSEIMDA